MPAIKLHKPAPVRIYLSIGSNMGDRESNLAFAVNSLPHGVQVSRLSPIYETEPWGYHPQPDFLNQVIEGDTILSPQDLLKYLKNIEKRMGRKPGIRFGPRIIDLDILLYGDLILETPSLVIPHPALHERAFVLVPLADLAPDLQHPLAQKTVRQMLAFVDSEGVRVFFTHEGGKQNGR